MKPIENGFIPALGTPLDKDGNLMSESFMKQIKDQISAGAKAILCMGSMGIGPYIHTDVFPDVVEAAVEATAGRVPVLVGAMDTSVARVKKKIESIEHLDYDALVFTPPFYEACNNAEVKSFYKKISSITDRNIFLYDHPYTSQAKITYDMVLELLSSMQNLKGIKSNDIIMFRKLMSDNAVPKDFELVFSGLDVFDVAYKSGYTKCLDGMLACTPHNTKMLFDSLANDDYASAREYLNNILSLRDLFIVYDL